MKRTIAQKMRQSVVAPRRLSDTSRSRRSHLMDGFDDGANDGANESMPVPARLPAPAGWRGDGTARNESSSPELAARGETPADPDDELGGGTQLTARERLAQRKKSGLTVSVGSSTHRERPPTFRTRSAARNESLALSGRLGAAELAAGGEGDARPPLELAISMEEEAPAPEGGLGDASEGALDALGLDSQFERMFDDEAHSETASTIQRV